MPVVSMIRTVGAVPRRRNRPKTCVRNRTTASLVPVVPVPPLRVVDGARAEREATAGPRGVQPAGAAARLRTGCLLRTETRLKAFMVIATQITAEISSSDSTERAMP
ncbi:hypothetical protein SHIRM173S_08436 [Streptomyces hirsutus]